MIGNYVFSNQVSAGYPNANIPPNYSWIQVDNNAGRPLYAQASYITNFDGLTVALTAGNVNIGDVHIVDPVTGLHADVADIGVAQGALRVLTQNFDSINDAVSIGDLNGKTAYVTNSALNVFNTNPISSISINNPVTAVQVLNPVTSVNIKQSVTNWDVLSADVNSSTYTTLPSNPANEITILNNTGSTIYIKNASKTIGLPIDNNISFDIKLVGNTNEVAILASSNNITIYGTFIAYN